MLDKIFTQTLSLAEKFPAYLPFFVILSIIAFILYKAHQDSNNKFSLLDFVSESNGSGHGSLEKLGMLASQLTITWWFVDLAAQSKAGVQEVLIYGGLMGVSKFASTFLSAKYGNKGDEKADK